MDKKAKIYLAGHRGLVGSAIHSKLTKEGHKNIVTRSHDELDLLNQSNVIDFFEDEKPEYVILGAAKVGGILANNNYRADFIYENLQIQNNVIHQSYINGVKKLLFLGSSCIYPRDTPQPILEEYLLTSPLEYTNEPYAIAKIAGIKMCESYNLQYGTDFISVMPTNLYGANDNYDFQTSHVIPAIMRKIHLGACLEKKEWEIIKADLEINTNHSKEEIIKILSDVGIVLMPENNVRVTIWGSGSPKREFLHSDDLADACFFIMNKVSFEDVCNGSSNEVRNTHINVGTGLEVSIFDLAMCIKEIVGFQGDLFFDKSKPDGTLLKRMDCSRIHKLGWKHKMNLVDGLNSIYDKYKKRVLSL